MSDAVVPEFVHKANAEKLRAEAEQAAALAAKARIEANVAEADLQTKLIGLERERHKRDRELVADEYERVYRFLGEVGTSSVKTCIEELTTWSRMEPGAALTIILHSPGGDVVAGMALWDFLQELRAHGHRLTTVARGYAASMAGILLQAGDERVMGAEAWLLLHEGSFGAVGSVGEVKDRVIWVEKIGERIIDLFTERISQADPATATRRLTRGQLKSKIHRTDWWISSDEALKFGLIDRIA